MGLFHWLTNWYFGPMPCKCQATFSSLWTSSWQPPAVDYQKCEKSLASLGKKKNLWYICHCIIISGYVWYITLYIYINITILIYHHSLWLCSWYLAENSWHLMPFGMTPWVPFPSFHWRHGVRPHNLSIVCVYIYICILLHVLYIYMYIYVYNYAYSITWSIHPINP